MKATIDVLNREEAEQIRDGLADAKVRAFVKIIGVLNRLPSDRARARVLTFMQDHLEEQRQAPVEPPPVVDEDA